LKLPFFYWKLSARPELDTISRNATLIAGVPLSSNLTAMTSTVAIVPFTRKNPSVVMGTGMPGSVFNFCNRSSRHLLDSVCIKSKIGLPIRSSGEPAPRISAALLFKHVIFLSLCIAIASKDCSRSRWYDYSFSRSFFSVFFLSVISRDIPRTDLILLSASFRGVRK